MSQAGDNTQLLKLTGDGSQLQATLGQAAGGMRQMEASAAQLDAQLRALDERGRELYGTFLAMGDSAPEALAAAQKQRTAELLSGESEERKAAAAIAQQAAAQTDAAAQQKAAAEEAAADREIVALSRAVTARREEAAAVEQAESKIRAMDQQTATAVEAAVAREVAALQQAMNARAQSLYGGFREAGFGQAEASALAQTHLAAEIEHTGKKAFVAAQAGEAMSKSMAGAATQGEALGRILGMIDPRLTQLTGTAVAGGRLFGAMFSPVTLAAAAAVAAIKTVDQVTQDATRSAKAFADQQQRIKDATVQIQTDVAAELGKRGMGSEAAWNAATAIARRKEEEGFDKSAASRVAAAVVDESGTQTVDEDTLSMLIAGVQRGDLDLGGKTDRERQRNLKKAIGTVAKDRDSFMGSATAFTRPRARQTEEARRGDLSALKEFAKRRGATDQEAEEYAKAQKEQIETGKIGHGETGGMVGEAWQDIKDLWWMNMPGETKAQERRRIVSQMGPPSQTATFTPSGPPSQPAAQPATQPGVTNVTHNSYYGPVTQGRRRPNSDRRVKSF